MARAHAPFKDEQRAAEATSTGHWLVGGGEMGKLIRSMDWSATPLGPLETWPNSLRTTVSLYLSCDTHVLKFPGLKISRLDMIRKNYVVDHAVFWQGHLERVTLNLTCDGAN